MLSTILKTLKCSMFQLCIYFLYNFGTLTCKCISCFLVSNLLFDVLGDKDEYIDSEKRTSICDVSISFVETRIIMDS